MSGLLKYLAAQAVLKGGRKLYEEEEEEMQEMPPVTPLEDNLLGVMPSQPVMPPELDMSDPIQREMIEKQLREQRAREMIMMQGAPRSN